MSAEFYLRKIAEWEEKQKQASEDGEYAAWQQAEREIENYKLMLERVK